MGKGKEVLVTMSAWPAPESRGPRGSNPEILPASAGAAEAAGEAALLVDLAIRRARANPFVGEGVKESICGPLEDAKEEILLVGKGKDRAGLEVVQGYGEANGLRQANGESLEASEER